MEIAKDKMVLTDEAFCLNELNHYTSMYFNYMVQANNQKDEAQKQYLLEFVDYCKEHIYHYAKKLLSFREEQ